MSAAETGQGRSRAPLAEAVVALPPAPSLSPRVFVGLVRLGEFLLVCCVGFAVYAFYIAPQIGHQLSYMVVMPLVAALAVVAFETADCYHVGAFRAVVRASPRIAAAWTLVFLLSFAAIFFLKLEGVFSRAFFFMWFVLGLAALLGGRLLIAAVTRDLSRQGLLDRRTAIVGGGEPAERLLAALSRQADSDLRVLGVFDDRADDRSPDLVAGYPKLGGIDDLVAYARHARLDLVICTLPISAENRILDMLRTLWVLPVDIRLAAHSQKLRFRPRNYSYVAGLPVLDMADKPIADWGNLVKSLFDRSVGALILLLSLPVMALAALAIKLDSRGPVLFRQKRYGFNNEMIEVLKFRSMHVEQLDPSASRLVTRDDPRVTRVGRFLRRTSIDELPQLFNVVFRGDLSLVGPRPHAVHARAADRLYDEVVDGYFARHRVKPGITGWAQINGWRGETDTSEKIQKRVEHDLQYIENWSVWFDLYILAATPLSLLRGKNAY
jgi:Undecaprenyl-phosphate glucose phosphotransferase